MKYLLQTNSDALQTHCFVFFNKINIIFCAKNKINIFARQRSNEIRQSAINS